MAYRGGAQGTNVASGARRERPRRGGRSEGESTSGEHPWLRPIASADEGPEHRWTDQKYGLLARESRAQRLSAFSPLSISLFLLHASFLSVFLRPLFLLLDFARETRIYARPADTSVGID